MDIAAVVGPWYVAHLHGRREKQFRDRLTAQGHVVYLPMRISRRRERTGRDNEMRWVKTPFPLFPAYAFVAAPTHEAIYAAKATNILWSLRPVRDQGILVRELVSVQAVLDVDPERGAECRSIKGRWCQVLAPNPYAGCTGIVEESSGRFFVPVETLGRVVPVEIDAEFLEPI